MEVKLLEDILMLTEGQFQDVPQFNKLLFCNLVTLTRLLLAKAEEINHLGATVAQLRSVQGGTNPQPVQMQSFLHQVCESCHNLKLLHINSGALTQKSLNTGISSKF